MVNHVKSINNYVITSTESNNYVVGQSAVLALQDLITNKRKEILARKYVDQKITRKIGVNQEIKLAEKITAEGLRALDIFKYTTRPRQKTLALFSSINSLVSLQKKAIFAYMCNRTAVENKLQYFEKKFVKATKKKAKPIHSRFAKLLIKVGSENNKIEANLKLDIQLLDTEKLQEAKKILAHQISAFYCIEKEIDMTKNSHKKTVLRLVNLLKAFSENNRLLNEVWRLFDINQACLSVIDSLLLHPQIKKSYERILKQINSRFALRDIAYRCQQIYQQNNTTLPLLVNFKNYSAIIPSKIDSNRLNYSFYVFDHNDLTHWKAVTAHMVETDRFGRIMSCNFDRIMVKKS